MLNVYASLEAGAIAAIVAGSIVGFLIIIYLMTRIRIVRQTQKYIVERLGAFYKTWGVGLHFLMPFVDRVTYKISMKETVVDYDPQAVITKDNVTMQIDAVLFFQVTDPKLYAYGVEDPMGAISSLSATTLRNIIGELDLDETLTSRDIINEKMRAILDDATDAWGIKVHRVEVKNIIPPKDIREAMERQMRAERERREKILLAEGEKRSAILSAEGEKESRILRAEADKQVTIKNAEGDAESIQRIQEARAQGILAVGQAESKTIELIRKAGADEAFLKLRSYETLEKVANGNAVKLIIPSDIQNLATAASVIKEVIGKDEK